MRPKARMSSMGVTWQFPADLSIIAWLEHMGHAYDVVTDEDLHREGEALLKPYRVVLSGTHPEYISESILDAIEDDIGGGGRFIYLGGNGYYWNVGYHKDDPWCMEVRKLNSGMRAWQAFIDAMVLWGDADTIRSGLRAHFTAGAAHVCLQPVHADGDFAARARRYLRPLRAGRRRRCGSGAWRRHGRSCSGRPCACGGSRR